MGINSGCKRETGRENSARRGTLQNCAMRESRALYSEGVMGGTGWWRLGNRPRFKLGGVGCDFGGLEEDFVDEDGVLDDDFFLVVDEEEDVLVDLDDLVFFFVVEDGVVVVVVVVAAAEDDDGAFEGVALDDTRIGVVCIDSSIDEEDEDSVSFRPVVFFLLDNFLDVLLLLVGVVELEFLEELVDFLEDDGCVDFDGSFFGVFTSKSISMEF